MPKKRKHKPGHKSPEVIAEKKEKRKNRRHNNNLAVLSVVIMAVCLVVCLFVTPAMMRNHDNPYSFKDYSELSVGMSYDEAVKALDGKSGEIQSSGGAGLTEDGISTVSLYVWKNKDGSSISVTFDNGIVTAFTQSGLDDGSAADGDSDVEQA